MYCSKKVEGDLVAVSGEECESCIQFKNKHIQYPIEVNKIKYEPFKSWNRYEPGTPVRIMPCAKEYKEKTYLGMYLGNLPTQNYASYERKNKQLDICTMNNPAIFVFELKRSFMAVRAIGTSSMTQMTLRRLRKKRSIMYGMCNY